MSDSSASTELLAAAKDAASRSVDFYAMLALPSPAEDPSGAATLTREAVQRAWRKASFPYHPDKAGERFDKAKWEEFATARDVLGSDEARAAYDGARSASLRRARERDLMSARQRAFAEELERAEGRGRRAAEEERERAARGEAERAAQAARGRAVLEERRRKVAEAEERERERGRREDDEREGRIRELEERIADKARRRAERRAKKDGARDKSGVAAGEHVVDVLSEKQAAPGPEPVPTEQVRPPAPAVDVHMSDDPVRFWEAQWPKTKARLLAAQATKERRIRETQAAA